VALPVTRQRQEVTTWSLHWSAGWRCRVPISHDNRSSWAVRALHGMKCGICHYVSSPDGPTHNARTCPLKQTQCRRSLHEGHPFFEPGHCVSAGCVHKQKCNTCGITGHLYGTQALTTRRWKLNKNGRLVRKQTSEALKKEDFVCTLMTELSVKSMVDNSVSVSTAAAQDAHTRRVATSRLRGNVNAERLGIEETVRVMEGLGSEAALLQDQNKKGFKTLYANAHLGAVEANRLAASAAESSLDEATPPPSDGEEDDLLSTPGVDGASPWSMGGGSANGLTQGGGPGVGSRGRSGGGSGLGGRSSSGRPKQQEKSERRLLAGRQSRTARYAAAVAKGQARSSRKSVGQKPGKEKGKALRAGAASASAEPIDVDAAADGPDLQDWPFNTRARFETNLPVFFSPRFSGTPPLRIAHAVVSELYQCPFEEVDSDMAGIVVKGAIDSQVRGFTLTSGTLCAAQVAEWLCAAMTQALRFVTLPSMALAILCVVEKEAAAAAEASGVGVHATAAPAVAARVGAAGRSATAAAPVGALAAPSQAPPASTSPLSPL